MLCRRPLQDRPAGRDKILAIRALMIKTLGFSKEKLPSRVYSKDLIELLFYQPDTK
jgi:hypothetical protein